MIRGDSGFATPELYDLCDLFDVEFLLKLKANAKLHKFSRDLVKQFNEASGKDFSKPYVMYHDFFYQATSWSKPERVVCRVERAAGELLPRAAFIVTTLKTDTKTIIKALAYNLINIMKRVVLPAEIAPNALN